MKMNDIKLVGELVNLFEHQDVISEVINTSRVKSQCSAARSHQVSGRF
jgi:hypothetical protein